MPAKVYSTVDDYRVCALPGTANRANLRRQLWLGMKTHLIKKMGSYIYIAACGMHLANTSLCTSVYLLPEKTTLAMRVICYLWLCTRIKMLSGLLLLNVQPVPVII